MSTKSIVNNVLQIFDFWFRISCVLRWGWYFHHNRSNTSYVLTVVVQQTSLAKNQDVVVVTINYRTNVFGFPFGSNAAEIPISEHNLGLLDQELALQWARS